MRATFRAIERLVSTLEREQRRHWAERDSGGVLVLLATTAVMAAAISEWIV